jgi:hypothetical protein
MNALSRRTFPLLPGARAAIVGLLMSMLGPNVPVAPAQDFSALKASPAPSPAQPQENLLAKMPRQVRKPIPMKWKLAIVAGTLLIGAAALWLSLRVWKSSNLFGRQYHFPPVETANLRLGAMRSGGHMATITFRDRDGPRDGT